MGRVDNDDNLYRAASSLARPHALACRGGARGLAHERAIIFSVAESISSIHLTLWLRYYLVGGLGARFSSKGNGATATISLSGFDARAKKTRKREGSEPRTPLGRSLRSTDDASDTNKAYEHQNT